MITKTNRGFLVENFFDLRGIECSLQESSLATEYAIWFGTKDAHPTLNGVPVEPLLDLSCLHNFDDRNILHSTRMHLSQKLTKPLLKCLKNFLKGNIFEAFEFTDIYHCKCSMRISDGLIELGVDDPNPQYCHQGWKPLPYPDGTKFTTHMFLDRKLIEQLVPQLKHFVKTGELSNEDVC